MITLQANGSVLQVNTRRFLDWTLDIHIRLARRQDGTLRTWKKTPAHLVHHIKADAVTTEKYDAIVAFFKATAGYAITFFDEEGTQHNNCFLLTEPLNLERMGRIFTGELAFDLQEPLS
jgi:hypothetical protein